VKVVEDNYVQNLQISAKAVVPKPSLYICQTTYWGSSVILLIHLPNKIPVNQTTNSWSLICFIPKLTHFQT